VTQKIMLRVQQVTEFLIVPLMLTEVVKVVSREERVRVRLKKQVAIIDLLLVPLLVIQDLHLVVLHLVIQDLHLVLHPVLLDQAAVDLPDQEDKNKIYSYEKNITI